MAMRRWIQVAAAIGAFSLPCDLRAQTTNPPDQTPAKGAGTLIPGTAAETGVKTRPRTNSYALGFLYDPNLTDLERIDALIAYRKATGEDQLPNCFYGPVERRIPRDRLVPLFQSFEHIQRSEAWKLLLAEPEDPNAAPVKIAIRDKNGPNCPDGDENAKLQEQRQQLLKKQGKSSAKAEAAADPQGMTEIPPSPVNLRWLGDDSPLVRVNSLIHYRAHWHLDQSPDCYYGPVDLRIPMARVKELAKQFPMHTGEEDWQMLMAERQDPNAPKVTVMVKSGRGPDCPAGDIDARLREERQRLLDEQSGK